MSDYWKLNIKDYTLHEIHNLFGLKEPHTTKDIIDTDLDLTERIKTDGSIDNDKKKQILTFLSKAKEKLLGEQKIKMAKLVKTRVQSDGSEHMVQNIPHDRPQFGGHYVPGLQIQFHEFYHGGACVFGILAFIFGHSKLG